MSDTIHVDDEVTLQQQQPQAVASPATVASDEEIDSDENVVTCQQANTHVFHSLHRKPKSLSAGLVQQHQQPVQQIQVAVAHPHQVVPTAKYTPQHQHTQLIKKKKKKKPVRADTSAVCATCLRNGTTNTGSIVNDQVLKPNVRLCDLNFDRKDEVMTHIQVESNELQIHSVETYQTNAARWRLMTTHSSWPL